MRSDGDTPPTGSGMAYDEDVPVAFRNRKARPRRVVTLWTRTALIFAGLAVGLIGLIALGPGIEFFEYWYLVLIGFGILGLLLVWETIAAFFSGD
ncbi:MAG: hypothetical protein AAF829_04740 [Pseudomonadota bacterium]